MSEGKYESELCQLTIACDLASKARTEAITQAQAQMEGFNTSKCSAYHGPMRKARDLYVQNVGVQAWERQCREVLSTFGRTLEGILRMIPADKSGRISGQETVKQYAEGLITYCEAFNWAIYHIAILSGMNPNNPE